MRSALDIPISVTRPIPQPVDKSTIELVLQVFLQQLVFHFFVKAIQIRKTFLRSSGKV